MNFDEAIQRGTEVFVETTGDQYELRSPAGHRIPCKVLVDLNVGVFDDYGQITEARDIASFYQPDGYTVVKGWRVAEVNGTREWQLHEKLESDGSYMEWYLR